MGFFLCTIFAYACVFWVFGQNSGYMRGEILIPAPPPVELQLDNRRALGRYGIENARYTPPGAVDGHYLGQYLWDSCFSIMLLADHGFIDEAKEEFEQLLETQNPTNGFMPNMSRHARRLAILDLEWHYFTNDKYSDYTQPAMLAQAALSIYNAFVERNEIRNGEAFLITHYPKLKKAYDYFVIYRQNSVLDPIVGLIHTNETGTDSSSEHDRNKPRLKRSGIDTPLWVDKVNPILDYIGALSLNRANYKVGWDIEKIRKHYWLEHVMFNSKLHENYMVMSDIAKIIGNEKDHQDFRILASKLEQRIIERMWVPKSDNLPASFYSLNLGKHIPEVTISNLYPLLLPNLPLDKLIPTLDLLESGFMTNFPLPTVWTKSRNFDPHFREWMIMWRGPVWQWTNRDVSRGLKRQSRRDNIPASLAIRCAHIAEFIDERSEVLVTYHGHYENHDPYTGQGYRVSQFAGAGHGYRSTRRND